MVKMKGTFRGYIWWPNLDKDIKGQFKTGGCQETANNPTHSTLQRWEYPAIPWYRLLSYFSEPIQGKMVMVVIDALSKWPDIFVMENTSAEDSVSTLHWRGQFNFQNCTIYLKWSDYLKCFNWTKCITGLIGSTAPLPQSSLIVPTG